MTEDWRAMRHADGELDADGLAAFEAALAEDPELRTASERQHRLRAVAATAFDDVLAEPVPERLLAALRPEAAVADKSRPADLGDIAAARARRAARFGVVQRWGSLAATLVIGIAVGRAVLPAAPGGALAPDAGLVRSLDAAPGAGGTAIRVGLSYRDKAGDYCRVFRDDRAAPGAGIACRAPSGWSLTVLAAATPASRNDYRTAAADLPPAVLAAIDASIAGAPLDAPAQAAAAAKGWRPG